MSKLKFNGKQTVSVLLTSAQLVTGFVVAEVESTPVIEYAYTEDDLNEEGAVSKKARRLLKKLYNKSLTSTKG